MIEYAKCFPILILYQIDHALKVKCVLQKRKQQMWSKLFKLKRILHAEVNVARVLKRLNSFNKSIVSRNQTCKGMTNEVENMFTLPHRLQQMF